MTPQSRFAPKGPSAKMIDPTDNTLLRWRCDFPNKLVRIGIACICRLLYSVYYDMNFSPDHACTAVLWLHVLPTPGVKHKFNWLARFTEQIKHVP